MSTTVEVPQISSSTTTVACSSWFCRFCISQTVFSTIAGRYNYSARSLTRPLCTTTRVMVQIVQSLDHVQLLGKVVDTPVVYNDRGHGPDSVLDHVQLLGKVVDTPVVCNDRGHCPDRAIPGQGCCYASLFLRQMHGFQKCVNVWKCRRCSSALLGTSL